MTANTSDRRFAELDQRFRELPWLPYLALGLALLLNALTQRPPAGTFEVTAAIAVAAATFNAWMTTRRPDPPRSQWTARVYVFGLTAFAAALSLRSPWFGFFSYLGFPYTARYLTGIWREASFVAVSMVFAITQVGGLHPVTTSRVVIWALVVCLDLALTATTSVWMEQRLARRRAAAELAEANQRREEIAAENIGLQTQLLTQAREAGVLAERQRLAREIHDTLAQGLTGIVTQLEAAQRTGDPAEHQRRIANAKQLARDGLAEARRSVQALRPQALDGARLPDALAAEVARWSATSGVGAEVTTTGESRPLHPEVEVALLRVAQEALANVGKHAGASHAGVTLSYMEDVVTLDIRDDGAGFDAARPAAGAADGAAGTGRTGGFGLTTMRQRVERLAGQLEIESEPGWGTAVSATVPAIPGGAA